MTSEIIKRMFDACYQAKRTRDMLPPLPEGVRASFIQYLDVIQSLERKGIQVKVSDLSDAMELPRPGVTRTVKEMEEKGYPVKRAVVYETPNNCAAYRETEEETEAVWL